MIAVQVDSDGFVSAVFDNKQVRKIAQIGLATFPNPDGLTRQSSVKAASYTTFMKGSVEAAGRRRNPPAATACCLCATGATAVGGGA